MPTVDALWRRSFGNTPPVGFALRAAYSERWVRIHNLPECKRYPDSPSELSLLLARQNSVANCVLVPPDPCYVFIRIPGFAGEYAKFPWFHRLSFSAVPSLTDRSDPDEALEFAFACAIWRPGSYDDLLIDVAIETVPSVTFYSPIADTAFAPYDGGADIIAGSKWDVPSLKVKWRDWLSPLPSAL